MNKEATPDLRNAPAKALAVDRRKEFIGALREPSDKTNSRGCAKGMSQPEFRQGLRLLVYCKTALRLGLANVARVVLYRTCKRAGIYRRLLPRRRPIPLDFRLDLPQDGAQRPLPAADRSVLTEANELLNGRAKYFSVHAHDTGSPPNWFLNPFQKGSHPGAAVHWSEIADFDAEAGDIKVIWEMSRFSWATIFARAWRISGNRDYLLSLHRWIEDWWWRNPPNVGPNWMCGQETSIRLINTLLALRIAGAENSAGSGLTAFVEAHCRRVDVTTFYAVAQDNNHGTSEAAGLFVGGTWLAKYGEGEARCRGQEWAEKGRRLLNERICRLVSPDGSFSQHSLTYHRMMLDTVSVVEAWRRYIGEASFSTDLYRRAAAATRWLGEMIDPASGDVPNLGANDGAHPFRLDAADYRDFRPCLQLASALFVGNAALKSGPWDESAVWLGVRTEGQVPPWLDDLSSTVFEDGGYVVMRNRTGARVLVRAPTAQFRPAHADALHLDLWWKGKNVLRDGGTYGYADSETAMALASAGGHNVPQFDGRDQMRRLGRFLYGDWIRVAGMPAIAKGSDEQSWAGSYRDDWGAQHKRTVTLKADTLAVLDHMEGFKESAVLRWRLIPGDWSRNETGCASSIGRIHVESSVPIRRISLESGCESRHYLEKSVLPVLEVEIDRSPAVLTTIFTLS